VEYIISRELFQSLPEEEKRFWHSHAYEVTSGMLYSPRLPQPMENKVRGRGDGWREGWREGGTEGGREGGMDGWMDG
jgi:hypothetical protein